VELIHILVFSALAALYFVLPARARTWFLFVVSVIVIYWLQPTLNIRWLDYSLPTLTLVIVGVSWALTKPRDAAVQREDIFAALIMIGLALLLVLPRYVELPISITSRPPPIEPTLLGLSIALILGAALTRLKTPLLLTLGIVAVVVIFAIIKTEPLTTWLASLLRANSGQDVTIASAVDVGWLGFSYVAFRLISTIRDRQMGILPALTLREYVTYVIFFPAYTAGPIDRAEPFIEQYRTITTLNRFDADRITQGLTRIMIGLAKKFVIADSLAVFSLNADSAAQANSSIALWLMLYAYAFRLFLDFSGYSDIAIGIGILFGIKLPENFNRPYSKANITVFWQSWHASLSNWARTYIYAPLSRNLLRTKRFSNDMVVLLCNLATMIVIGLWHGVTLPFFIWGLWHGIGLFTHKAWTDRTRKWYRGLQAQPSRARAWNIAGILLTFHFVLLGWVWFALPDVNTAATTFARLFGIGF